MYNVSLKSINDVLQSHVEFYKGFNLAVPDKFKCLPYFHWLPKLHKTPYGSRFIAASSRCTTTLVSKILPMCPGLVRKRQQIYYDVIYRNSGIKRYWLIQYSEEVSDLVSKANSKGDVTSIKMYDFNILYTNLPHAELKTHSQGNESFVVTTAD